MKVILLQDIKSLGKKGDIKDVSEGYARNFLFPKKMAGAATDTAVKLTAEKREKEKREMEKTKEKMRQLANVLKEKEIVLKSKEKGGKLFGSISKKDISKALQQSGMPIKEENVILQNPIKKTGEYKVDIKLSGGMSSQIKLKIEGI